MEPERPGREHGKRGTEHEDPEMARFAATVSRLPHAFDLMVSGGAALCCTVAPAPP